MRGRLYKRKFTLIFFVTKYNFISKDKRKKISFPCSHTSVPQEAVFDGFFSTLIFALATVIVLVINYSISISMLHTQQ